MTTERLTVTNFGPIRHADIELTDFIVFIGPQASGKSTLAKLIHFFRYISGNEPFQSADANKMLTLFKLYFPAIFWQPDSDITYQNVAGDYRVIVKFTGGNLVFTILERTASRALFIPASRSIYALVSQSMFSLAYEDVNIDPLILLFGKRMEAVKKQASIKQADERFVGLMADILKGQVTITEGEERIYFANAHYVTLPQASSGQQETVPLLLMLLDTFYSGEAHAVTIEEPEAHLYPYSQYKLIEFISRCYNAGHSGGKFVITTHSPYILTAFNNLLFAHQVAHLNEEAMNDTDAIVSAQARLKPDNFAAYYIEDGSPRAILDNGLIADNEIDDTSEDIAEVFDRLLAIYRRHQAA